MVRCKRIEEGKRCRHRCTPDWVMCHKYCKRECVWGTSVDKCERGWHIRKSSCDVMNGLLLPISRESANNLEETKRRRLERFQPRTEPATKCIDLTTPLPKAMPKPKQHKINARLEIHLARLRLKTNEIPSRKDVEAAYEREMYGENRNSGRARRLTRSMRHLNKIVATPLGPQPEESSYSSDLD